MLYFSSSMHRLVDSLPLKQSQWRMNASCSLKPKPVSISESPWSQRKPAASTMRGPKCIQQLAFVTMKRMCEVKAVDALFVVVNLVSFIFLMSRAARKSRPILVVAVILLSKIAQKQKVDCACM